MIPFKTRIKSGVVQRLEVIESLSYQGNEIVPGAATDELAKVSSNDTTAGYLNGKLVAGSGIVLTENNNGGNETLTISANAVDLDVKVSVSANDTTAGYLNGKLVAGTGITFTENNNGGDETLTVTLAAHTHAASDVTSGVFGTARLATTGTASASTYLRGDQSWSGLDAGHITAGTVPTARLGTGTANSTTYLRGDQTWQTIASGVTGFTPSQNTASPNNVVNASRLLVDVVTTNGDIVLQPKGTGAVLAQLPDSTATGGNKRGANSVDLQTLRNSSGQVASGTGAVVMGAYSDAGANYGIALGFSNSTGSGSNCVVIGNNNSGSSGAISASVFGSQNSVASNYSGIAGGNMNAVQSFCIYSFVGGGYQNYIGGGSIDCRYATTAGGDRNNNYSQYGFIGGGQQNRIGTSTNATSYNVICGGNNNVSTATYGVILGGNGNTVSNQHGIILAGQSGTVQGDYGVVIGGNSGVVQANYGVTIGGLANQVNNGAFYGMAMGTAARSRSVGQIAFSNHFFAEAGDTQGSIVVTQARTTSNTATKLTANGQSASASTTSIPVFANTIVTFKILLAAKQLSSSNIGAWEFTGCALHNGSSVTIFGLTTNIIHRTDTNWSATVTASTFSTEGSIYVEVTGTAGNTIQWTATSRFTSTKI